MEGVDKEYNCWRGKTKKKEFGKFNMKETITLFGSYEEKKFQVLMILAFLTNFA